MGISPLEMVRTMIRRDLEIILSGKNIIRQRRGAGILPPPAKGGIGGRPPGNAALGNGVSGSIRRPRPEVGRGPRAKECPRTTCRSPSLLGLSRLLVWGVPAAAHDRYPARCCSGHDCDEIAIDELELVEGSCFVEATGAFYPRVGKQESLDGKFHRYSVAGQCRGADLVCLFALSPTF